MLAEECDLEHGSCVVLRQTSLLPESFLCAVRGWKSEKRKGKKKRLIAAIEQTTLPCILPSASIAVSGSAFPVQSNLAGGVSAEHSVVKQKSDLLRSPLALAPFTLLPLEITLNDICYHRGNLCQPRDRTADAGGTNREGMKEREWRRRR